MQPVDSPYMDGAVLLSMVMLVLFWRIRKQVMTEEPDFPLTPIQFFWFYPFAVLRQHRAIYPESPIRGVYMIFWTSASALLLVAAVQIFLTSVTS